MIKKNCKLISFILTLLFFNNSYALDDSDIFLDAVFFSAVKKSNYDKVLRMIEEGISLNIDDSDGLTPLAYALKNDDEKMFDLLISKGADINKKILDGNSHLIFYISNKRFKLIGKIFEIGANINFQDRIGRTALMNAIEKKNLNAVNILIEKDYDKEITDYSGKNVLDYANKTRDESIKKLVSRYYGID